MRGRLLFSTLLALGLGIAGTVTQNPANSIPMAVQPNHAAEADAITIPRMLSYQGKLTDALGVPVPDTTYSVVFRLYTVPAGGSSFWSETQTVRTTAGLFSTQLGSVTPIDSFPQAGICYLGMRLGPGTEMTPRIRIASAAYSYLAHRSDTARFAETGGSGDNAWKRTPPDSVLYTTCALGVAKGGVGNALLGDSVFTHVNLGIACTTGTLGQSYRFATVGGGRRNLAAGDNAAIGGGYRNRAIGSGATVAGGSFGDATGDNATVCGGYNNDASGVDATVVGGYQNSASGDYSAVAGGEINRATGDHAIVAGGASNRAAGRMSFAAGQHAKANHISSFVWSDSTDAAADSVYSTLSNQWRVRTRRGVAFYTNRSMTTGAWMTNGQNGWTSGCDRSNKENFEPVDKGALLDRLARLPVTEYTIKDQIPKAKHIGPVAQDFHAAFGYGESELGINTVDADGVLLAAVQALYEQSQIQQAEIEALKAELRARK